MILRGIDFGYVLTSAGARNFFGEGYWFHRLWPWSMMDFTGSTFVTKTITLNARPGNMPLCQDQLSPREFFPKCVKVYWRKGLVLNAVGLSGPGAKWLFAAGTWQKIESPFFISFMAVSAELKERREELWQFVELFSRELSKFKAKVGLEINFSCPNVGLKSEKLLDEVQEALTIAARLNIPLVPNFNPLVSPESLKTICEHPGCDAVSVANTIPWGKLPERIDWVGLFGTDVSPLAKFGGGGLSGWPLLPIVAETISEARKLGVKKPTIAGGGIFSIQAADKLIAAGASAIKFGTVCILRPWRVKRIIEYINQKLGELQDWE
ncbi:MAG: hypothetical protein A2729_00710 [Candidatus Buchananbacteria bacterium RIFCSPHIGHO2_01_FULL_39_14]|uniref:Dihydroorotate dehydrogenase catalytic domain-containing protein n=2 Tax=Candidatus Buchananiibacteriota TaxID=1817903 RepID=A0A1G1YSC8_9BACT|nr:MAG: hypothetical protein A2729_00710 [Candidatus Buchananbacteria bacterium RIFCSPHIGHO2_01_FULL_39_14]OGY48686.1 MAG: hypothetical protein A3D39_04395 [Candidatus Buchananbacteria bacterium RIFCSPHIGHO2_02_FULL_39_17]OGY54540.1 MAG: hypothetical protein A2912_00320 [Candidatus Buchananbacteria bacterium RIFCSPLOWO2_01_FULL_40_23b]